MQRILMTAAILVLCLSMANAETVSVYPAKKWQTRTPAQVGLNAAKLNVFRDAVRPGNGVIIKNGYLAYSWGSLTRKVNWASAAKPVLSTMLFYAIEELKVASVDAPIMGWNWDLIEKDQTMTFAHLANMVSGYPLPEPPGDAWGYNDFAIKLYNMTVFDRVFKQPPDQAVRASSRLGPLQFQDVGRGSLYGTGSAKYRLTMTPRDFARIGWFWLNKGKWGGTQRLPASYFDTFMAPQVPAGLPRTAGGINDYLAIGTIGGGTDQDFFGQGRYGFNWWFNQGAWPDAPADTIQARGHFNAESMVIIPSLQTVVAWRGKNSTAARAEADLNRYLGLLMQAFQ